MSNFQKCSKLFPKVSKRVLNMFWGKFFGKFLPSFPWRVESSKFWEQSKKSQKSKNAQNRSQKCREMFSDDFFEKKFMHSVPWRFEFSKIFKKKIIQKSKKAENCSQECPNVFLTCFGAFSWKVSRPVFHGGSRLLNLEKKPKKSQYSEFALNLSQKCPKRFWGDFFEKNLCTVFHGGSSFRKFSKKNYSKIQKGRKLFPKVSKRVLNMFWGIFFGKFLPSFPWRVESSKFWEQSKKSQKPKYAQNRSQKCPNVFWTCFGANFLENFCPLFRGGSSLPKFSKKNQNFSKFQKCPKEFPKLSKRVLNVICGKFFEKFLPSFPWRVESSKFFKKNQKLSKFQKSQIFYQKCPNVFWTCFGANFLENFCPLFRGGSSLPKFSKKNQNFSKFQKCPKEFPKLSKRVLNVICGKFFEKFLPSFPWRVESSKFFKKKPKTFKVPKKPNILPKVSKRVLNMFWGKFFGKSLPSFPWRVESSKFWEQLKKSQKSKNAQNRSQKCPNVFWTCFGAIFLKNFMASVPWRLETSKIFEKNLKNVKIPKMFKIVRKSVQKCFGVIFSKKFYSECSMEGRVFENFKKIYIQKSKKAENCSQKCPNVFWTCFGANFLENFCPVFRGVSSLPKFSKKLKKCQISKNVQNCSQKCPNVFWTCFGENFLVNFCPVFHGGSSPLNFENSRESLKNPKMPKIVPKSVEKCFRMIFSKKIYAQCSMEVRVFENFQKKNYSKIQKGRKLFPRVSKCVLNMFRGIFLKSFLASVPWRLETENFQKKLKKCQNSKKAQHCSQKCPEVFWGDFFEKILFTVFHGGSSFRKFSKKNIFKNPKRPEIVPKSVQTCFEHVLGQIFRKIFEQFSVDCRVF